MIINSTGNQEILYDFIIDEIGHFKTLIDLKQSTSLVRCLMEWDQIPQLIMCFAIFPFSTEEEFFFGNCHIYL